MGIGDSPSAPWRSLNQSVSRLKPGDTLVVREGLYAEQVTLTNSGTDAQPITIVAHSDETPIIDGATLSFDNWSGLFTIRADHIVVDGLILRNAITRGSDRLRGFRIYESKDITLRNCTVHNVSAAAIMFQVDGGLIENCTVYDGAMVHSPENRPLKDSGDWNWPAAGFDITSANNVVLRRCLGYRGWGEICIADKGSTNVLFEENIFHTLGGACYTNRSQNITWRRNFIYTTPREDGLVHRGLFVANEPETADQFPPCDNVLFENNIVVGVSEVGCDTRGFGGMQNITFRHNTIVNVTSHSIYVEGEEAIGDQSHTNFVIENNIFYGSVKSIAFVQGTGVVWRNNCWGELPVESARGPGDIVGDPELVNAGGDVQPGAGDPDSYKLTAGSPCIDVAHHAPVAVDYFGGQRA